MTAQEIVTCRSCGHAEPMTDELAELAFKWLAPNVSKTSCRACGCFTIQRPYTWDAWGRPIAGEFLIVKTFNRIGKAQNFEPFYAYRHLEDGSIVPRFIRYRRKTKSLEQIINEMYEGR